MAIAADRMPRTAEPLPTTAADHRPPTTDLRPPTAAAHSSTMYCYQCESEPRHRDLLRDLLHGEGAVLDNGPPPNTARRMLYFLTATCT